MQLQQDKLKVFDQGVAVAQIFGLVSMSEEAWFCGSLLWGAKWGEHRVEFFFL